MSDYLVLLRENSNYRNLWLGSVVSQLGDWFNLIAAASLIADLTSTGTAISYLFLTRFLPLFLFSPFAGVLADRYNRRNIMIASDLLRAATVLCFLLVREPQHVWILYLLNVLQFALSAIFVPARSAVLANVVQPHNLVAANALDSFTWSTMLAFGALLGGIVAAVFGNAEAFILDAATFLLSAWFISRITGVVREENLASSGGFFDFMDGLRYLKGAPLILGVSLVKGVGSLAWGAINVVEVTYAEEIFPLQNETLLQIFPTLDQGTATLGLIYFVSGLGTGLGPLLLRRLLGDSPPRQRKAISAGFVLMIAGIYWLSQAQTFPMLVIGSLLRTIGTGTIWVFSAAMLQLLVPDRFRGRVFSFEFAFLTLTQSISTFWAGFAQDTWHLDVRQVTLSMSLVGLVGGLLWLFFLLRNRSRLDPPAPGTPI